MNPETLTITHAEALVDRYLAVWNEQDAARRRALVAQLWTDDASYVDPLAKVAGHAALDALIETMQTRFAGLNFYRRGKVEAHNQYVRFAWDLGPEAGAGVAGGTDIATVAADGRLQVVVGFLDYVPAGATEQ